MSGTMASFIVAVLRDLPEIWLMRVTSPFVLACDVEFCIYTAYNN